MWRAAEARRRRSVTKTLFLAVVLTTAVAFVIAACGAGSALESIDAGSDATPSGFTAPDDPLASDAGLGPRAAAVLHGCAGGAETYCHSLGAGGTYLRLGTDGDVVGVASTEDPTRLRVKPGAPAASYLYEKLLEGGDYDGGRMPLGGPYDPRLAPFVAAWIEAGAPSP